jgi:antitoxin VapB
MILIYFDSTTLMLWYISMIHILVSEVIMEIAKVFQTGRSQAVRLPKAFRFNGTEVAIKSFGRGVLLMPIDNPWDVMLEAINEFEVGFQLERADQGEQFREEFK